MKNPDQWEREKENLDAAAEASVSPEGMTLDGLEQAHHMARETMLGRMADFQSIKASLKSTEAALDVELAPKDGKTFNAESIEKLSEARDTIATSLETAKIAMDETVRADTDLTLKLTQLREKLGKNESEPHAS